MQTATGKGTGTKSILIVDDEEEICRLLERVLKRNGYEALTASTGMEALVRVQDHKVDLVITDVRMPGISGLDLIKQLHDLDKNLPIIVISGYGGYGSAIESIEKGAFYFLKKPFETESILQITEKAMRLPHLGNGKSLKNLGVTHSIGFSFPRSIDAISGITRHVSTTAKCMGYSQKYCAFMIPFIIDELLFRAVLKNPESESNININATVTPEKIDITFSSEPGSFMFEEVPTSFDDLDISNGSEIGIMMANQYSDGLFFSEDRSSATVTIINKQDQ